MAGPLLPIVAILISLGSTAYSMQQAKKQKDAAKRAREARKGYEIPVEGEATNLPLAYGKVLVGGVRVYHNTKGTFEYPTGGNNSDKEFHAGIGVTMIQEYTYSLPNGFEYTQEITVGSSILNKKFETKTNSFIFVQQAICQGPISNVWDVVIEESRYINDRTLGTDIFKLGGAPEGALRIDVHNTGGIADDLMAANFGERREAVFEDMANADIFARLDRENPQFNGVPVVQFIMEAKLVRDVVQDGSGGYELGAWFYSNNSALVLLDYLLDGVAGKGIPLSEIHIESFYKGKLISGQTVQSNVVVGGKIYQPTDGSRNIATRDLPLYECNLIIDTKRPIRDNVETILATMGDARLVWSQGKYVLNMQYPISNEAIEVALELNDSNIKLDQEVEFRFPSASERLNSCTVKFNNEAENFKEDTVSWPPKLNLTPSNYLDSNGDLKPATESTVRVGVGASSYGFGTSPSGWNETTEGGRLLNNYSVWNGNFYQTELEYLIIIRKEWVQQFGGTFKLEYTGDDSMSYVMTDYDTDAVVSSGARGSGTWTIVEPGTGEDTLLDFGSTSQDKVYRLIVTAEDNTGQTGEEEGSKTIGRGVAMRLIHFNFIIWSTRDPTYDAVVTRNLSNLVYRDFLDEDNGMELETEVYAEGITDYYHALAKAEETVRTSRGAAQLRISFQLGSVVPEPGDFIRIQSEELKIGALTPLYFRVDEVKLDENLDCELRLVRFDYTFLAWAMKDNEYRRPAPIFDFTIPAPSGLQYLPSTTDEFQSSGSLDWLDVSVSGFDGYVVYAHIDSYGVDAQGFPIFRELGTTIASFFTLPQLEAAAAFLGVRTRVKGGGLSDMTHLHSVFRSADAEHPDGWWEIIGVVLNHPWLDENGNLVWGPNGLIGDGAHMSIGGTIVFLTDTLLNAIVPSVHYIGEFDHEPTQEEIGELWKQNAVYKNTVNDKTYILTGDPLGWVVYLESGNLFYLVVESSQGDVFRVGQSKVTTLIGRVFKNGAEITEQVPPEWFMWRRMSALPRPPPWDDETWNLQYISGYPQITIDIDDIDSRATFFCDIIPGVLPPDEPIALTLNLSDEVLVEEVIDEGMSGMLVVLQEGSNEFSVARFVLDQSAYETLVSVQTSSWNWSRKAINDESYGTHGRIAISLSVGDFYVSDDEGETWVPKTVPDNNNVPLDDILMLASGHYIITERMDFPDNITSSIFSVMLESTDYGETWTRFAMNFTDPSDAFIGSFFQDSAVNTSSGVFIAIYTSFFLIKGTSALNTAALITSYYDDWNLGDWANPIAIAASTNGVWIIVTSEGQIVRSSNDGLLFTKTDLAGPPILYNIVWDNGKFVLCGDFPDSAIAKYSADGVTWNDIIPPVLPFGYEIRNDESINAFYNATAEKWLIQIYVERAGANMQLAFLVYDTGFANASFHLAPVFDFVNDVLQLDTVSVPLAADSITLNLTDTPSITDSLFDSLSPPIVPEFVDDARVDDTDIELFLTTPMDLQDSILSVSESLGISQTLLLQDSSVKSESILLGTDNVRLTDNLNMSESMEADLEQAAVTAPDADTAYTYSSGMDTDAIFLSITTHTAEPTRELPGGKTYVLSAAATGASTRNTYRIGPSIASGKHYFEFAAMPERYWSQKATPGSIPVNIFGFSSSMGVVDAAETAVNFSMKELVDMGVGTIGYRSGSNTVIYENNTIIASSLHPAEDSYSLTNPPASLGILLDADAAKIWYYVDGKPSLVNGGVYPAGGLALSGTGPWYFAFSLWGTADPSQDTSPFVFVPNNMLFGPPAGVSCTVYQGNPIGSPTTLAKLQYATSRSGTVAGVPMFTVASDRTNMTNTLSALDFEAVIMKPLMQAGTKYYFEWKQGATPMSFAKWGVLFNSSPSRGAAIALSNSGVYGIQVQNASSGDILVRRGASSTTYSNQSSALNDPSGVAQDWATADAHLGMLLDMVNEKFWIWFSPTGDENGTWYPDDPNAAGVGFDYSASTRKDYARVFFSTSTTTGGIVIAVPTITNQSVPAGVTVLNDMSTA